MPPEHPTVLARRSFSGMREMTCLAATQSQGLFGTPLQSFRKANSLNLDRYSSGGRNMAKWFPGCIGLLGQSPRRIERRELVNAASRLRFAWCREEGAADALESFRCEAPCHDAVCFSFGSNPETRRGSAALMPGPAP